MKKILLFILVVIIAIFAYSQYTEYQRFHPKKANLAIAKNIDINYHNKETVYSYYEALEGANNYMQMQWSANNIDVRSPESDDAETTMVLTEYGNRVAKVNYYKAILEQSKVFKNEGLTNEDIKLIETKGISIADYKKAEITLKHKGLVLSMMPEKALYSGEKSAFVYEIQRLLEKQGYTIPVDGVYKNITSEALKSFEEKNNLFPDGKIDIITLDLLLK